MLSVEVLIAGVDQNAPELMERMNIESDAILVNQCDRYQVEQLEHRGRTVRVFHMAERGVGLSRNTALMRAGGDISLFSDQDIVYESGYEAAIAGEFERHPEADMILFNIQVEADRATYHNEVWKKVRWYNCGRYGAVSFAIRTRRLRELGVAYSLLFGGGAKYSAGEDSLFLKQLMDKGCRVYASPVLIGREAVGDSTWFKGYTEKFFYDRGVLYHYLYGPLAKLWGLRFLLAHREKMCSGENAFTVKAAYACMKKGIRAAKKS